MKRRASLSASITASGADADCITRNFTNDSGLCTDSTLYKRLWITRNFTNDAGFCKRPPINSWRGRV